MKRKFRPFDAETIRKEIMSLPAEDHKRLTVAMKAYQMGLGVGYQIKSYNSGIEMITDSGNSQGRCIYFTRAADELIVLVVYKKESDKAPRAILKLAKQRRDRFNAK